MIDVVAVRVVRPYVLEVDFSDGSRKHVDVEEVLWGTLFEPLKDPEYFAKARFDLEIGTVVWPNDADLAPEYLYDH